MYNWEKAIIGKRKKSKIGEFVISVIIVIAFLAVIGLLGTAEISGM